MIKLIIKEGRKIIESRLLISIVPNSKELNKIKSKKSEENVIK